MDHIENPKTYYFHKIIVGILSITAFAFPLLFSSLTTESFVMPKQLLVMVSSVALLVLIGVGMIADGKVVIRRTPFDIVLLFFAIVVLLSSVFSLNRFESYLNSAPFLFAIAFFFIVVNTIKSPKSFQWVSSAFILGGVLASIVSIFSFFKIYPLPFSYTQFPSFNFFGSLLDQAVYLTIVSVTAFFYATKPLSKLLALKTSQKDDFKEFVYVVAALITITALGITLYMLLMVDKPILLPFETGFQTAFAAISQDGGRVVQGFLFGSGFGTYLSDFTRFKLATFNANTDIWAFAFNRSSSFVLELLATVGFLGTALFVFSVYKIIKSAMQFTKNPMLFSVILMSVAAFVLPFSFTTQFLFFLVLALFTSAAGISIMLKKHHSAAFYDVELKFVAFEKGFIALSAPANTSKHMDVYKESGPNAKIFPFTFFVLFTLISILTSIYLYRFVTSDISFKKSATRTGQNNAYEIFQDQSSAINQFPWRDGYHRIYSQTTMAIATAIASNLQTEQASPSASQQQAILQNIQQSINSARNATILSPLTSTNWLNLSSIYQSLIGFGQNAEQFAVVTGQQAIALDPNNPQMYIHLGGIFYQLQKFEDAQRQFQVAVNLKPDFANARYNLGHALEGKGDFKGAMEQYLAVRTLSTSNQQALEKIEAEIAALEEKIGQNTQVAGAQTPPNPLQEQAPLQISSPSANLPSRLPTIRISPPPNVTPTPRGRVTPTITPSASPTETVVTPNP